MANITLIKIYETSSSGKKRVLFKCRDATAIAALPTTASVTMKNGEGSPIPMDGSEAWQLDTGDRYEYDLGNGWVKQPDTAVDVQAIRDDVATMQDDIADIKTKTALSQADIATMQDYTVLIKNGVDSIASEFVGVILTLTQGAGTVLTVTRTKQGATTLTTPDTLVTGDTLCKGDWIHPTVDTGSFTVTGATLVTAGYYRVDGGAAVSVTSAA